MNHIFFPRKTTVVFLVLHSLIWLGFIFCFWPGLLGLWQTYSSFWLFENAIAAGVIGLGFAVIALRQLRPLSEMSQSHPLEKTVAIKQLCLVVAACIGLLINNILGGFSIGPQILVYVAMYAVLGFYLRSTFWQRSLFVCLAMILTLPILERVQKYLGFPLRLFTAKVVSWMLSFVGAGHISKSTVIMTENHAASIDIPCSGVKSLYFGGVVLLAVYFLQKVKLSLKAIGVAVVFFSLLIFFNIWRVFVLIYVYALLQFKEAGDSIHVGLGLFGFAVSCVALWWLTDKYVVKTLKSSPKKVRTFHSALHTGHVLLLIAVMFLVTAVITNYVFPLSQTAVLSPTQETTTFGIQNSTLTEIPFTETEKTLFFDSEVSLAAKYEVQWRMTKNISLLVVKSTSARTHHDPELCLQGLGYHILNQEQLTLGDQAIQHLTLQTPEVTTNQADVYYWYVSNESVITDYSQRIWAEFNHPDQEWVLVEVAVMKGPNELTPTQLEELFAALNQAVREQLL